MGANTTFDSQARVVRLAYRFDAALQRTEKSKSGLEEPRLEVSLLLTAREDSSISDLRRSLSKYPGKTKISVYSLVLQQGGMHTQLLPFCVLRAACGLHDSVSRSEVLSMLCVSLNPKSTTAQWE